ncbi:MAG: YgjV family protein [Butyricicoccus sp.]|nr:YgjV family protein [Butyricicoccus sp.]
MALYIFSYQIQNNRSMIVCRMLGDLTYMVHYLMLGSYSGCVTLISILTVILTTWSGKSTINRLGKLFSAGPAWLIYCISVSSPSGAIAELVGMGSAALGLYRYGLKEHPDLP